MKITEIKGKYFSPSLLILSNNNCAEFSYNASIKTCHVLGIKKKATFFQRVLIRAEKKNNRNEKK